MLMNRFRPLTGPNSYASELAVNPLDLLPPHGRWLDIGCGTGVAVRHAVAVRADIEIVALDLERGFVDGRPLSSRLHFLQADAEQLPVMGSFDLVTAVHVLHFIDDKQSCVKNLSARLKAGGHLLANLDPNDVWLGESWAEGRALGGEPFVMQSAPEWGTFQAARSQLGGNRQGVTSRQSLYLK